MARDRDIDESLNPKTMTLGPDDSRKLRSTYSNLDRWSTVVDSMVWELEGVVRLVTMLRVFVPGYFARCNPDYALRQRAFYRKIKQAWVRTYLYISNKVMK